MIWNLFIIISKKEEKLQIFIQKQNQDWKFLVCGSDVNYIFKIIIIQNFPRVIIKSQIC